ncbi:MAG TPA: chromosomal replication initiator protein DnaA [Bryobacteraceae bacterium]|nr:chromosomal replication initiator protein DnaA [Bryobacteraceae bacterium]
MNDWDQIKNILRDKLAPESYAAWVERTSEASHRDGALTVAVADDLTREYMELDFHAAVRAAIAQLDLPVQTVQFVVAAPEHAAAPAYSAPAHRLEPEAFEKAGVQMNRRFTFEGFVVGPCNQFAHAAAQAVASRPSRSYNPLFIYGGVGMGKTHLMHAIGTSLTTQFPSMRVVYTTSERFVNLMIQCIRTDKMSQFHRHFRSADALLIDDIQFLKGKERTQEEFFHMFNELYDHQKQIVVSSDSPPKHVEGLVERLRSRFEWGLMVDVQPPDLETKMAILDKKAEAEGIALPEDVRIFIATRTKSNVRELEGALVKLIAYSSVSRVPITLAMAEQVLRHMVHTSEKKVTIDQIIRAVADKHGLPAAHLKQKTNAWSISYPRQIAMYIAKEMTQCSLPEIGRAFGGKHHTTVLHSVQKIEQMRTEKPDLNRLIHSVIDSLH